MTALLNVGGEEAPSLGGAVMTTEVATHTALVGERYYNGRVVASASADMA